MSKALVAKETIIKINPDFNITAHHKNIKELPINFFKQFNFLIMALDNIEARYQNYHHKEIMSIKSVSVSTFQS